MTTRTLILVFAAAALQAQELQPRAYFPAPVGLGFLSISYTFNSGGLLFDPSLPVADANVKANIGALGAGLTLNAFGRTAQVLAVLPYAIADLKGTVSDVELARHRSGITDSTFRFAINLYGAPAMHVEEFAKYRPKTVIGTSITVSAPTGQYDPKVLINIGTNRWGVKPELGISRFVGKWDFEAAFGAWLYSKNADFLSNMVRTQDPLGSVQLHVVRLLPRRMWAAVDGTFYIGGRTHVGDKVNADFESSTRLGATLGIAVGHRQAIKIAYFGGAIDRAGADISSLSISYQVLGTLWR
ncbi:MAG TPA: transporter [Bryobacteraceae bacterium]|nr:transporter [Bryobacteraceae bacterium]